MNYILSFILFFAFSIGYAQSTWWSGGSNCPRANGSNLLYPASEVSITSAVKHPSYVYFSTPEKTTLMGPSSPFIDLPSNQFSTEYLGGKTAGEFKILGPDKQTVYAKGKIDLLNAYDASTDCSLVNTPSGYHFSCEAKAVCIYEGSASGPFSGTVVTLLLNSW